MKQPPLMVNEISQKDNHTMTILWNDGLVSDYCLSALQSRCPCAACYDPVAGKQLVARESLDSNVRAVRIVSVGRYALKVQFTSGCSRGIYSFALLRQISGGGVP